MRRTSQPTGGLLADHHPIRQIVVGVPADILAHRFTRDVLHRAAFEFGTHAESRGLLISQPQRHRHPQRYLS